MGEAIEFSLPMESDLGKTTPWYYNDVIMNTMASQITSLTIAYSTVYSGADKIKQQSSTATGLCEGNTLVTGEFPAQRASNAENVSIWWRHHDKTEAHSDSDKV